MYIDSLRLVNLKSIKDRSLKFGKCNVIHGHPGSGKTTIVQGFTYGLLDYLPKEENEERIIDYVQEGEREFKIEILGHHKGKTLDLKIKSGDKGTKKDLIFDNEEFQNSNATEKLTEIFNPELVLFSSISLQDRTSSILFELPAERLSKLKALLGMNDLSEASEKMSNDVSQLKSKISTLKTEISSTENLKFELMEIPEQLNINKDLQIEFDLYKIKYDTYKIERSEYEKCVNEERNRKVRYDQQVQSFKFHESKLSTIVDKVEVSTDKLLEYESKITETIDVKVIDDELSKTRLNYQLTDKKLKLAKAGKCPECGQDFKLDVNVLQKNLENYKNEGLKLKNQKDEAEAHNKKSDNTRTLRDAEIKILKSLKDELAKLGEVYAPDEYKPREFKEPEFDNAKFDKLKEEMAIYSQRQNEIDRAINFNNKQKEKEKSHLENLKLKKQDLILGSAELSILEEGKSALDKEFLPFLLEGGLSFIETEMNNFFSRVNSKYKIHMRKDKKSVRFFYSKREGHLAPIGTLSGHERKIMSIAFRVALTSIQDFGILVMDEIDGSANDEYSLSLYKHIMELNFEQIFIITHKAQTVRYLANECGATLFNMDVAS